jgi:hemerythrin-like domain-containing protein
MARRADVDYEYDPQDIEALLRVLQVFGDDYHQAKEESALFPVFTAACDPSQHAAVRHALFEHEQDRSLIEGMQDAVNRANVAQFAEYARRLAGILRNHISMEDDILFETIAGTLSAEDDERVIAEFEAFEREMQGHGKDALIDKLRVLEWKYLRKRA